MERTFAPDPLFDRSRLARMQAVLEDFAALNADTFGALEVSHDGGRFCLRCGPGGRFRFCRLGGFRRCLRRIVAGGRFRLCCISLAAFCQLSTSILPKK